MVPAAVEGLVRVEAVETAQVTGTAAAATDSGLAKTVGMVATRVAAAWAAAAWVAAWVAKMVAASTVWALLADSVASTAALEMELTGAARKEKVVPRVTAPRAATATSAVAVVTRQRAATSRAIPVAVRRTSNCCCVVDRATMNSFWNKNTRLHEGCNKILGIAANRFSVVLERAPSGPPPLSALGGPVVSTTPLGLK